MSLHEVIIFEGPRRMYPENPNNLRTWTHSVHCPEANSWCATPPDGRCSVEEVAADVVERQQLPPGRYLIDRDDTTGGLVWYEAGGGVQQMHEVLRG